MRGTDLVDLQFRFAPEPLRQSLAQIGALIAIDRLLYGQTAVEWAAFDDDEFNVLDPPVAPAAGHEDAALETAIDELCRTEVLNVDDVSVLRQVRAAVAHVNRDVLDVLADGTTGVQLLDSALALARKLEIFWARVHADSNPAFDNREIEDDDISAITSDMVRMISLAAKTI